MSNEEIAKLVGEYCYGVNKNNKDFAVQLFVEKIALPDEVEDYTDTEMAGYILKYLESR